MSSPIPAALKSAPPTAAPKDGKDAREEIALLKTLLASEAQAKRERADMWMEKAEMLDWLHAGSEKDAEGFEWGVYRVKWENGKAVQVWQTLSDLSDLRTAMEAGKS